MVVIGVSAGGLNALQRIIGTMPAGFPIPILIVQHVSPDSGNSLAELLDQRAALQVKEADEQETAVTGTVYLAPPNYHLLVEQDATLSLSIDPPVSFARPSVDVLFESAAMAFGNQLIAVVLTGANEDGSRGAMKVKSLGGVVIVQDPSEAEVPSMPLATLNLVPADYVATLEQISRILLELSGMSQQTTGIS